MVCVRFVVCLLVLIVSGKGCKFCIGFSCGSFVCVYFYQFNLLLLKFHVCLFLIII